VVGEIGPQVHFAVEALGGFELPDGGPVVAVGRRAVFDEAGPEDVDPLGRIGGIEIVERIKIRRIAAAVERAGLRSRARILGLNPQDVAQTLQTLLSGYAVTTVRAGTEKVEVVARF
jgi:hypothetical protein